MIYEVLFGVSANQIPIPTPADVRSVVNMQHSIVDVDIRYQ